MIYIELSTSPYLNKSTNKNKLIFRVCKSYIYDSDYIRRELM